MNYFDKLQQKIDKYKSLYSNKYRKAAIKMACWNFVQLVGLKKINQKLIRKNINNKIALLLLGGIGDILIGLNYAYYLREYFKKYNIVIDIFVNNTELVKSLDGGTDFHIFSNSELKNNVYLLKIRLVRYPQILENNIIYTEYSKNEKLINLIKIYQDFYKNNNYIFDLLPYLDGITNQYSFINGHKRIQQPDIANVLNITCDFIYSPKISNESKILNNLRLESGNYITINRGVDNQGEIIESTKLWSSNNFNILVNLIKSTFTNYKIVQLGASIKRCELIDNVDINLVGKTSLNELKVLLKHSALHIDGEGGMVHLRKSLQGGVSVVIFGPTSADFYGYSDNVNISSSACPLTCEWINNKWASYCINKNNNHICMKSIKPNSIFEEIKKILK